MEAVRSVQPFRLTGRVAALRGMSLHVSDLPMPVGSLVRIESGWRGANSDGETRDGLLGEVVGFDGAHAIVMLLGGTGGVRAGDRAVGLHAMQTVGVGEGLLGRVIDGLGRPMDGRGALGRLAQRPIDPAPLSPLARGRVTEAIPTGVRAMDMMTTLGKGQRLGVFAGPGVGKSTLLGNIARQNAGDVSVVALIGERGKEVSDFIERELGPEGLARSVVVVATGDQSPLLRVRAALVACAVAEHFRDRGADVMLIMDSVTRFAHAQRQIGLSVGEPPATRGYTPSVFAALARLLERAGALARPARAGCRAGTITGVYSVLVEGDDMTEPVADASRGILDGHVILSRALAQRGHYPAIDVLDSVSRVAAEVCDEAHVAARQQVLRLLAKFREIEDLVQIGAYARGSNALADVAIRYVEPINELLRQDRSERVERGRAAESFVQARSRLVKLAIESGAMLQQLSVKKG
ncbi:MAG: FliI/YscN family ATPase [Phycisphaeraceae bacterium]|nr:FliI/YscN family ATPase [Phycisphaeraceae bacterium]